MNPRLSLKILLFLFAFFAIFLLVVYRTQQEYNSVTLATLEHQFEMDKKIQEAEDILGESVDKRTFEEKKDELIANDLKKYNTVTFETAKKVMDLANQEIRRKNGWSVE